MPTTTRRTRGEHQLRSGTTYIFSDYLSGVDSAWAAEVGKGKAHNWPVGEGAKGNGSVAATVFRTPFSVGYVERSYAIRAAGGRLA